MKKALEAIALTHSGRAKLLPLNMYGPMDWEIAKAALGKPYQRCRTFPEYDGRSPPEDCVIDLYRQGPDGQQLGWPCTTCLAKWFARNGAKKIPTKRKTP